MQLLNILCVSQLIAVSLVHPVQQVKRVYILCASPVIGVNTQKVCCLVTSRVVRSSCKEDKDLLSPALTQEEPSIRPMPCPSSAPTMHHCTRLFPEVSTIYPSSSHTIKAWPSLVMYNNSKQSGGCDATTIVRWTHSPSRQQRIMVQQGTTKDVIPPMLLLGGFMLSHQTFVLPAFSSPPRN